MCRAQLLQSYPAEMRDHLLFGERQIPLACLVGEIIGGTQPVANMLSDCKPEWGYSDAVVDGRQESGKLALGVAFCAAHRHIAGLSLARHRVTGAGFEFDAPRVAAAG